MHCSCPGITLDWGPLTSVTMSPSGVPGGCVTQRRWCQRLRKPCSPFLSSPLSPHMQAMHEAFPGPICSVGSASHPQPQAVPLTLKPSCTECVCELKTQGSASWTESGPRLSDPAHRHSDEDPTTPWTVSGLERPQAHGAWIHPRKRKMGELGGGEGTEDVTHSASPAGRWMCRAHSLLQKKKEP